jgi:hypothetical protein
MLFFSEKHLQNASNKLEFALTFETSNEKLNYWRVVEQKLFQMSVCIFKDYRSNQFLRLKFSHTQTIQSNSGSIQDGGSKFDFLSKLYELSIYFQSLLCIWLVEVLRIISKFLKKPRCRLFKKIWNFSRHLDFFLKLFFPWNIRITSTKQTQKRDRKNIENSQSYVKITNLIRHLESIYLIWPFWPLWQNLTPGHIANKNIIQKSKGKKFGRTQRYTTSSFGGHIGI